MTPEDAVRERLLRKLRGHDPEAANRLSDDLDADYLKHRLAETNRWATGWWKWVWIVAIAGGLAMLVAPLASDGPGVGVALGGTGMLMGLVTVVTQWRRKRELYEMLAVLADPTYEP
jgi:hypothetical protein